jgi:hypothetical protein
VHPERWNKIPLPLHQQCRSIACLAWSALCLGNVEFMLGTNVEMVADEVFCRMPNNGSQRRRPAATSCNRQTHDVLNQSLERRDALCFHNEYSDEV